ncbi:MAG TPA: toll/interleukin-1 receptor domain-containing protein [Pyrinomonadaceae bacterium]|jgi:tetratricopeptide (TPR) repeat protein
MPTADINVFISYSHDSSQHEARVLALADHLRADGINAIVDQYQLVPLDGWQLWMEKQIRDAQFVLLVCTETYLRRVMKEDEGKGLGVMWESTIIYSHLYSAGGVSEKFIPIVFEPGNIQHIPSTLQATTYYDVGTDAGYDKLYRRLTNQHETPAPPIGMGRVLPPLPRPTPTDKGDKKSSRHLTNQHETPTPSNTLTPNLVHPYALQANFTGRVNERRELTAWLADDAHPIYALIAMGGMGKSALAWYWMQYDLLPAATAAPIEGVMWWSFYEGESSFAKFIDEALKYASQQETIDAERFPTTYDRAQELRKLLQRKRILFILDGFERQLRAYASLDAAYRADDTTLSHDDRACVDPTAARLLYEIAAGTTRAKVLITTRLPIRDLEDRAGGALAGVLKRELEGLPRDDALKFMHEQGVTKGTPAEISGVCTEYGYHPLSLRLLSGLIANDARKPGDIAAAPRHDVHSNLIQRQHHVLEQSYNALPKRERALLSRIAAFRSPMTYDALVIFNTLGNETRFDAALEDLRVRGLLQRDIERNRYDFHPIVRRYAYDRLADKEGVHTRLRDYFANIPVPDEDTVQSIEDLLPIIELYHHTASAGRYDEARELFRDRLNRLLYYRFGAYQLRIELLRTLFPDGEDRPPRLKDEHAQSWTLNGLANSYGLSGQSRRAVPLSELSNKLDEKLGDKRGVAIGLGNSADDQIKLGELAAAESNLRRLIELGREIKDDFTEGIGHQELGRLLAYRGVFDEAAGEFGISTGYWKLIDFNQGICLDESYRSLRALLIGDARAAREAAQRAFEFWKQSAKETYPNERDRVNVEWLWGAALLMEGKDLSAANAHLTEALTRCRRINLVEFEPDVLLAWARLFRARGDGREAQAYVKEALAIADRCEYRLAQAEIHNFLARLAIDAGKRKLAREQAEIARERAWCDGPPHCYKPALDEAEAMLREVGAEEYRNGD